MGARRSKSTDDLTELHALQQLSNSAYGVQFRPESIGTAAGVRVLQSFLTLATMA